MMKKIALALALGLTLASLTAPIGAPTASACGGYGAARPEEVALYGRVFALARHIGEPTGVLVTQFDGDRATATVHFAERDREGNPRTRSRIAHLRRRQGVWRISAWS